MIDRDPAKDPSVAFGQREALWAYRGMVKHESSSHTIDPAKLADVAVRSALNDARRRHRVVGEINEAAAVQALLEALKQEAAGETS